MLTTEIKSLENINKYDVDLLIIPTIYSAVSDIIVSLDELNLFKNKKIALKMDKIIDEYEINELELYIKQSLNYDIDYYLFTDMSIYYILKKYNLNFKAVFFSKTINCSSYDIKEYNEMGIKCLVSTELQLDDLIKISNLKNNFIYIYGYFNIFYSKRELLSLYKTYSNLDYISKNKKYTLLEETRNEHYPVIENNNGTFVFSSYCLLMFKEIDKINKNNFFYIDSNFIEEDKLIEIIDIYNLLFTYGYNDGLYNRVLEIDNNIGTSFLYIKPEVLKENK